MEDNISCPRKNLTWILNHQSQSVKLSFLAFSVLIVLALLIFNPAVIIRLQLTSKHKYFTKFFLTSLAVADILVGLTVIPFMTSGLFYDNRYVFGELTCEIANSCDVMFTTVSIFHLSTLAFERFVALRCPLSYGRICGQRTLIILFIVCWMIPVAISFGLILPKFHMLGVEELAECTEKQSESCVFVTNLYFATLPGCITIFLPIILIVFFNVEICLIVRRQRGLRSYMICNSTSTLHMSRRMFSKETRIALTIGLMTSVFLVCWLPFFIFNLIIAARPFSLLGIIFPISTWLGYANSAANPIMFLILDVCHKTSSKLQTTKFTS